ncbi:DUF6078 family protein [Porphyromonas sp. COT-290 OH3588]|uniref:DUF6078 family protein n=1 Tax=Porphyromonas sp. COT-290 OH3588 TaxID=1515617 RepID=UPI0006937D0C|nr:DUF6078 family protein [Porphyromonas sp. COT-290 OH3588]
MAVDFRPELMRKDIVYCMRSECPLASSCLRYLSYKHSEGFSTHSFVDPRTPLTGRGCKQYVSNEVQRMARGFKSAMGLVQHRSIAQLRAHICYELDWGRSHFYRYASGEYLLTLEQQKQVTEIFAEFGVAPKDGVFDSYEESYEVSY